MKLKRTLSLVLAVVMVLGMFGIASAASFPDDKDIQYKEAVDVMTGIGAIDGMGDGTFNPTGAVTRAQAAKMVAYAVLGKSVAEMLPLSASSFTDVNEYFGWAIPSIEYLVSIGAINGRGDGTFDPNGNVTAYEIAKMLLCALGYGKNGEFVGTGWDLNIAILANNEHVYDGRATDASALGAHATREECALYTFNVLMNVEIVNWNKTEDAYKSAGKGTIADNIYGMKEALGVITDNQATAATNDTTDVRAIAVNDDDGYDEFSFNIKTGLDLVGHYVKVYYKSTGNKGVTYAVIDQSKVVNTGAIANDTAWKKAFGSTSLSDMGANTNKFTNYAHTTGEIASAGTYDLNAKAPAGTYILAGTKIVSYMVNTYALGVVTAYKAPTATTTGSVTINTTSITIPKVGDTTSGVALAYYAGNSIYAGIAKDDVVYTTSIGGSFNVVTKAAVVVGIVKSFVSDKATVNGTAYEKSTVSFLDSSPFAAWDKDLVNKNCALYLGPDGTVMGVITIDEEGDSSLVYAIQPYVKNVVTDYAGVVPEYYVIGVDMTGTVAHYQVAADDGILGNVSSAFAGNGMNAIYEVSVDSDGIATFDDLSAESATVLNEAVASGDNAGVLASSPTIDDDVHYYATDVQFIFVSGSLNTTTGANTIKATVPSKGVKAIPAAVNFAYTGSKTGSNGLVKYVVVNTAPPSAESTSLIFAPGAFDTDSAVSYTKADGTFGTAYEQIVYVDGAATTIIVAGINDSAATAVDTGFYTFSVNATTGLYTLTKATSDIATIEAAVVTNAFGGYLSTDDDVFENSLAGSAFIVDVVFDAAMAADPTADVNQINTLTGLTGAEIWASFTTNTNGVKVLTGIYVTDQNPA